MGIAAWHLLKKRNVEFFSRSFRIALVFALVFSIFEVVQGHLNGGEVAQTQPTKLAAMESHWETQTNVPQYLFSIPDPENERNLVELFPIPGALSILAYHDPQAEVKGLKEWPKEDRPPVSITFWSFRIMVGLGFLFVLLTIWAWFRRNKLTESPWLLKVMLWSIPLPYIASEAGWTVAEVGRQPWIVYGLMKTSDAVSPLATSQVATTLIAFIVVYGLLGLAAYWLMFKYARNAPELAMVEGVEGGAQ
jgi:cytochrome d ubiquinol oxidase subunit I